MDSLKSLVVGEKDCTFKDVLAVFFYEVNSVAVFKNWTDIAIELSIDSLEIEEWRRDMLLDKLTIKNVLQKILESWKTNKGNDATLPNLIKHLENIKLTNVADDLKKFFSTGNRVQKGGGQLFMPTLPNKPTCYIPRTLVTRKVIDVKVFSSTQKDVFVLDGIDRYGLSQLAEKELTDISANQVRKHQLSVRFILLQHFGDWALLCGKTTEPIHLLRYHEGRFHWICTKNDISALQKASEEKTQNELSEKKFIEEMETDLQFQPNQPICISDSPGMEKSLLLASIGRQLQQRYAQRFIAFIVISEFVVKLRELLPKSSSTKNATVEALLQICENSTAREQLLQTINTSTESPSTQVELMFDGFDEVSTENSDLAHECLKIWQTNFNNTTRVWVTTRPQHLHELEKSFSVFGYNIQAFQEQHQIDFLTSYWNSQELNLDGEKLQKFSKNCISTLKKTLNKKDEDIAGIPLQCMMIAEVYMQDSHRVCDSKNKSFKHSPEPDTSIDINSIADLYEKMISHKIGKFINTYPLVPENINLILPWHMYLALELIFPSHAHEFKDTLQIASGLEPDYLVNIGILECRGSTAEDSARFIHRTFAEYLAARYFVLYEITNGTTDFQNASRRLSNFLFQQVLKCFITGARLGTKSYYRWSFRHSVLCHFLDALLGSLIHASAHNSISKVSINYLKHVINACIRSDFGNIVKFLRSLKYPDSFCIQEILYSDSEIVIDATEVASLSLLKFLLQNFRHKPLARIKGCLTKVPTPIHAAVRRGSYTIFEYILKEHHFADLVKQDEKFLDLVYHAVADTLDGDLDEIQDRVQIVKALCDLNRKMLNYRNSRGETSLLANRVNIKLLKKLIECGSNLFCLDEDKHTILHKATEYLSATDYYDLLQGIPKTTLHSLLQVRTGYGEPTLHLIVAHGLATPNILDLILSNGVGINMSDKRGRTCMFYALQIENDDLIIPTVKMLLENGADYTHVNCVGGSIVHYSAFKGRIDCLEFFLTEKNMNVNQVSKRGETPIVHALYNINSALETVVFLLERGADYKIVNARRCNILHRAASNCQVECLELFLRLGGVDINLENKGGDTPLLCALYSYHENRVEMIRLLLDNGADHRISNKKGNNVLRLVAANGNAEYFTQFVRLPSLKVNARNCDGDTPLHTVFKNIEKYFRRRDFNSFLLIIEALLSLGADVNAKNNYGKTPLAIYEEELLKLKIQAEFMKTDVTIRKLLEDSRRKSRRSKCNVQ